MATVSTTDILISQKELAKRIKDREKQFTEATAERKTLSYLRKLLSTIRQDWDEYNANNELLKEATDLDGGHDYFRCGIFESTEVMKNRLCDKITDSILEIQKLQEEILKSQEPKRNGNNQESETNLTSSVKDFFKGASTLNLNESQTETPRILLSFLELKETIKEWIDDYNHLKSMDDAPPEDLSTLRDILTQKWQWILGMQPELLKIQKYNIAMFEELERQMFPILVEYKRISRDLKQIIRNTGSSAKLPKLEMPKFDGNYMQYQSFKALFMRMVDKKADLDNCERLAYLKGQLSGEPAAIIAHLAIENASYTSAWELLNKRYDNKHALIMKLIDKMIKLEPMGKNYPDCLTKVVNVISESFASLDNLGLNGNDWKEYICFYILDTKLDGRTRSVYESSLVNPAEPRKCSDLLQFLNTRLQNVTAISRKNENSQPKPYLSAQSKKCDGGSVAKNNASLIVTSTQENKGASNYVPPTCSECSEKHTINQCKRFLNLTVEARLKKVKDGRRCINCLKIGHNAKDCKSRGCKTCNRKHNSLLHDENKIQKDTQKSLVGAAMNKNREKHVFLATAIVKILDKNQIPIYARALLDSGSQLNIMTENLKNRLGVAHRKSSMKIAGIGNVDTASTKRAIVEIQSTVSSFAEKMEVFIIKNITSVQPTSKIEIANWHIPENISLADPKFNIPASVDLIIGGELFFRLITSGFKRLQPGLPDLQNTVFGWVVTGSTLGLYADSAFVGMHTETSLDKQISQFWKIEEKGLQKKAMTTLEKECEKFFKETTTKDPESGKFVVRLQFIKEPQVLGLSREMATRRFLYLEKKLGKNQELKKEYSAFMNEYKDLGHMVKISPSEIQEQHYFIPHHAVLNPGSSTTKLRVVFDASAKTSTNVSLNEILANGPILQDDLFSIMVRFRTHTYVISADITKMYRQVLVHEKDQAWQLIIWRENESNPLEYYKLLTLTYGTTCASYLAIKALQTLADQHKDELPLAAAVAKRDFNVDDVMTGADNLETAVTLQQQLVELTEKAHFHLHKWCANHPALLEKIPKNRQEVSLDFNAEKTETKALGTKWIPKEDVFKMSYTPKLSKVISKRTVLSETAQLFDPLGLVNPVIVTAKIFIQELWAEKIDWDTPLQAKLQTKWEAFRKQLMELNQVKLPRHIVIPNATSVQIHAFSDASTRAYGTCCYLRSTNKEGSITSRLICSKSRVAPIIQETLPRLELCAASTMTDLVQKLREILGIKIDNIYYWTDSELVLSWILNEGSYKTFVANRVATINRKTDNSEWKYINTKSNPADLISRGASPEALLTSKIWWNGPEFLQRPEETWPAIKPAFVREPKEERVIKTILMVQEKSEHFIERIDHRNSIKRLQFVVAIIRRMALKSKPQPKLPIRESLRIEELREAMTYIIKYVQQQHFETEMDLIRKGKSHKTKFTMFTPIIDKDGVLRVGGRLQAANISSEQKHPILLPKDHFVTRLIMEELHMKNKHAGPQALLAITRQRYWPEAGKKLASKVVRNCVLCVRSRPVLMEQIMGKLPADRVNVSRVFNTVALDFAGPIEIHHKLRGKRVTKAYICIFVCFTTKAVHIEPAADLTIDGFINCLKRFIARRGAPKKIYCDNATNFRGTHNQLKELSELIHCGKSITKITTYCQDNEITWKFSPARSPHFNGLAEACVKSAKWHLRKILHSVEITYDELGTFTAEIEAILNSRPLTPMSNDPNDLQPLTAGHFLIGAPMTSLDDGELKYKSKIKMWHNLIAMRNEFWHRWSSEYITQLQQKNKWRSEKDNVKIGQLVIMKEDDLKPLQWKMGRIMEVYPDETGVIRVVGVKTSSIDVSKARTKNGKIDVEKLKTHTSIVRRAVNRICVLPVEHGNNIPEQAKSCDKKPSIQQELLNPNAPEFEPVARRTRSKGIKQSGLIMVIGLILLSYGAFAEKCSYKSLEPNPGIVFEKIGQMGLISSYWNINSYVDLEAYWTQSSLIEKLIGKMESTCVKMDPSDQCNGVIQDLKEKHFRMKLQDDLFTSFPGKQIIRKREEGNRHDITNAVVSRKKRGWINLLGNGFHVVAGVMDNEDAQRIDREIDELKKTNNYIFHIMGNQTSIQDLTKNVIKSERLEINRRLATLEKEINQVGKTLGDEKQILTMYIAKTILALMEQRETQQSILDLITNVYHGHISSRIITPSQLKEHLKIIVSKIPSEISLPDNSIDASLNQYYSILEATASTQKNKLILQIKIPLINREKFYLHHMVPVPLLVNKKLKHIISQYHYFAINTRQDRYYMLSNEQKRQCKVYSDELIVCERQNMVYNTQFSAARCELAIFKNLENIIQTKCKIKHLVQSQAWVKMTTPNSFIFGVINETRISTICNETTAACTIEGTGILSIPAECSAYTEDMEFVGGQVYNSNFPIIIAPATNLSEIDWNKKEEASTVATFPQNTEEKLAKLDELIEQQRNSIMNGPNVNSEGIDWQHIHHFTVVYLLIGLAVALAIWWKFCHHEKKHPRNSQLAEVHLDLSRAIGSTGSIAHPSSITFMEQGN